MIRVNLDVSPMLGILGLTDEAHRLAQEAGDQLTKQAEAKAIELATSKLHSRKKMYLEGLRSFQESENVWVVEVDASVRWIEDGLEPRNLLDSLLSSPKAKRSKKDGSTYLVVPFEHSGAPTEQTSAQRTLSATLKQEFKKFGVPFSKIEKDDEGNPKLGVLHNFDVMTRPLKTARGPGQGHGPIGAVRQGPTGIPFLQGVQVSQKMVNGKPQRFVTTFRVASSKHRDQGRWDHPGLPPAAILDEVAEWARQTWHQKLGPELVARLVATLS